MKKTFILILLVFALVGICVACPPQCGPGEVWGVVTPAHYGEWHTTSYCDYHESSTCQRTQDCQQVCHTDRVRQWEAWGYRNNGQCVSDCKPDGHGNTCAKSCDSYVNVQHCEEECHYHYQHRTYYPAVYGCVATTCPAVPCPSGQDCVDGQCLPRVCPRIPCDTGFHCEENQCDPDICGEDYQCEQGYVCNPELTNCIRKPSMTPYTESACQELINAQYPMDGIDPSTLTEIGLDDTYISASFKYASQFDCVALAYYTRGEPSFSKNCKAVEFFNRKQDEVHSYGGMPILTALDPAQAICVLAVKNSPSDTTLPVTITLTDSFGNVGDVITSPEPVIKKCYSIPDVFDECRMAGVYLPFSPWVGK